MLIPPKITQPFKYGDAEMIEVSRYLLEGDKCSTVNSVYLIF
jgi:hypothetical protein